MNMFRTETKPVIGPTWYKHATVGAGWNGCHPDGFHWEVTDVEDRGRTIKWRCAEDGRVATTTVHPGHPYYPTDPTPEELRAESLERLRKKREKYA